MNKPTIAQHLPLPCTVPPGGLAVVLADGRVASNGVQEREKRARGADGRKYPWGDSWQMDCCNTSWAGIGDNAPVDRYPNGASPYGLLDMAGNVWEWCEDWYDSKQGYKALRGGSWEYGIAYSLDSCGVLGRRPEDADANYGFRCARNSQ